MLSRLNCFALCACLLLSASGPAGADMFPFSGSSGMYMPGYSLDLSAPGLAENLFLYADVGLPDFLGYMNELAEGGDYTGPAYYTASTPYSVFLDLLDLEAPTITTREIETGIISWDIEVWQEYGFMWYAEASGSASLYTGAVTFPELGLAFDVSDIGFYAFNEGGDPYSYVDVEGTLDCQVVPEPSTCVLLGAGLAGLCARASRRFKDQRHS